MVVWIFKIYTLLLFKDMVSNNGLQKVVIGVTADILQSRENLIWHQTDI